MSTTTITVELEIILNWHRKLSTRAESLWQNGISNEDSNYAEKQFQYLFPPELKALYSWHNGTKARSGHVLGHRCFFPGFYFLSLQQAIEECVQIKDSKNWRSSCFPIFSNDGGDYYGIECDAQHADYHSIFLSTIYEFRIVKIHNNLQSMLQTLCECFKEGAFYLDSMAYLRSNISKVREIGKTLNPEIEYWSLPTRETTKPTNDSL